MANFIVINKDTLEEVPYRYDVDGSIIIYSINPADSVDTCIVTTTENLHKMLQERRYGKENI